MGSFRVVLRPLNTIHGYPHFTTNKPVVCTGFTVRTASNRIPFVQTGPNRTLRQTPIIAIPSDDVHPEISSPVELT
jgi:hypothetical protein